MSKSDKASQVFGFILLVFLGYVLAFGGGFLFFGAASGDDAWNIVYVPYVAIIGAVAGAILWFIIRKRSSIK